jgi:phosphorylase kinase alpha/beta subunit
MERVYRQACLWHHWWLVRYCAGRLRKTITSLAPSVTNLLVRGKQLFLGISQNREVSISSPSTPAEIANAIFNSCPDDQPQVAVFQQELIIACSDLVSFVFWRI